jgi:hypothetical protein
MSMRIAQVFLRYRRAFTWTRLADDVIYVDTLVTFGGGRMAKQYTPSNSPMPGRWARRVDASVLDSECKSDVVELERLLAALRRKGDELARDGRLPDTGGDSCEDD